MALLLDLSFQYLGQRAAQSAKTLSQNNFGYQPLSPGRLQRGEESEPQLPEGTQAFDMPGWSPPRRLLQDRQYESTSKHIKAEYVL